MTSREMTAVHEAAHAVMVHHYKSYVYDINLNPDPEPGQPAPLGRTRFFEMPGRRSFIAVHIAGLIAEHLFLQADTEASWRRAGGDLRKLKQGGISADEWMSVIPRVDQILRKREMQVARIAVALMSSEYLDGCQIVELLSRRGGAA